MKKKLLLFAAFLLVLPFLAQTIYACSCAPIPPIYETYKNADAVFTGKVLGSKDVERKGVFKDDGREFVYKERIFQIQMTEAFKGVKTKEVMVNVGTVSSSCYSGFTIGESYLIYAYGEDGKIFSHRFCSRSADLEDAQDQIYFIRELLKGKPEPQIYGAVKKSDNDPQTNNRRVIFIEGVKIVVEGGGKKFETVTDKKGVFRFNNIPAGDYKITAQPTEKYMVYFPDEQTIRILPSKKIAGDMRGMGFFDNSYDAFFAQFSFGWNNEVKGKIYDAEGKEIKFAAFRLLSVSKPFSEFESKSILNELINGKYSCADETPGRYFLVAEIYAPFGEKDKTRIFYPQSETPEKASVINLKATDKLTFDFILPPKYVMREIKGQVFRSDGQAAEQAQVSLQKKETYPTDEFGDAVGNENYDIGFTDESGNFVLHAFENAEYWLHVKDSYRTDDGSSREITVKSKPIKIKIEKTNEPLKIILAKP